MKRRYKLVKLDNGQQLIELTAKELSLMGIFADDSAIIQRIRTMHFQAITAQAEFLVEEEDKNES